MTHPTIERARSELLEREQPARAELLSELAKLPSQHVPELLSLADDVRSRYCGNGIAVEVLYNAKRGGCSEDCNFCSQSARYATDVEPERLSSVEEFVEAARAAQARGAGEFCIVVAVRGPSERLLERVCEAVVRDQAGAAADRRRFAWDPYRGAYRTSRRKPASTRSITTSRPRAATFRKSARRTRYDERWETCLRVKQRDLELCCGGIIGMGEDVADRIDFLTALQELSPQEVPINFLNPRPGTPFGLRPLLDPVEALRFVAMARLALPSALVRFAGGREVTLRALQDVGMRSGASGIVLGNYLTTEGRNDADDFAMLDRLGFEVLA